MKYTKFCVIVLLLLVAVLAFAGCENEPLETTEEATFTSIPPEEETIATDSVTTEGTTEETTVPLVEGTELKMTYLSVMLPQQVLENMLFESVVDGDTVMEVFSLKQIDGAIELFRVFYGKTGYGNEIGTLNVDGNNLTVSVVASNYDESVFADEETSDQYYAMMENLNLIVGVIQADPRFSSDEGKTIHKQETQVAEWNFSLPEDVQWEETYNENSVKLSFFTEINGVRADLYAVSIGGETLQSVLGQYTYNGEMQPISVGTYPSPNMEGWEEKDITNYYQMMDSINDVIQTVQSNESFSEVVD